jgi:uncharacterized protein (DUF302 family)
MSTPADQPPGVVILPSHHPVAQTVGRLEGFLKEKGVLVFARIDFSADGRACGSPIAARAAVDLR